MVHGFVRFEVNDDELGWTLVNGRCGVEASVKDPEAVELEEKSEIAQPITCLSSYAVDLYLVNFHGLDILKGFAVSQGLHLPIGIGHEKRSVRHLLRGAVRYCCVGVVVDVGQGGRDALTPPRDGEEKSAPLDLDPSDDVVLGNELTAVDLRRSLLGRLKLEIDPVPAINNFVGR